MRMVLDGARIALAFQVDGGCVWVGLFSHRTRMGLDKKQTTRYGWGNVWWLWRWGLFRGLR